METAELTDRVRRQETQVRGAEHDMGRSLGFVKEARGPRLSCASAGHSSGLSAGGPSSQVKPDWARPAPTARLASGTSQSATPREGGGTSCPISRRLLHS